MRWQRSVAGERRDWRVQYTLALRVVILADETEGPASDRGGRLAALRRQLQSLGLAGVLAYGLLNTLYYTTAFVSIWVWAVGAPRGEPVARHCAA